MKRYVIFLTLVFFIFDSEARRAQAPSPHFFVVIPTYRNKDYCIQNITKLVEQTYKKWQALVIVDGSPEEDDGTYEILEKYIAVHDLSSTIFLMRNSERRGALDNIYTAIHDYAEDDWVVVLYDGDDYFKTPKALDRISCEYIFNNAWFTYGQYVNYPKGDLGHCHAFPPMVIKNNNFRHYPWVASHPRTFYAWLFKKIDKEDLMYQNKFFDVAWDVAFMPMLEMASYGHIRFISDILYVYRHHARNDYKLHLPRVTMLEKNIRARKKYEPLRGRNK